MEGRCPTRSGHSPVHSKGQLRNSLLTLTAVGGVSRPTATERPAQDENCALRACAS